MGKLRNRRTRAPRQRRVRDMASSALSAVMDRTSRSRSTSRAPRRGSRRRGPEYWAKKVLVEKLKKKYWKAKYGGR